MTGHYRPTSRLALAKGLLTEDERHAIFLPNATVTLHAVLIQDGLNVVAEANRITSSLASQPRSHGGEEDDGNKHRDNARSTGWGLSLEHNRYISISIM